MSWNRVGLDSGSKGFGFGAEGRVVKGPGRIHQDESCAIMFRALSLGFGVLSFEIDVAAGNGLDD